MLYTCVYVITVVNGGIVRYNWHHAIEIIKQSNIVKK